ncbi:hypothetical protein WAX74_20045 [Psychrobacillus sp. FJAT-51614]|uniref:Uncharacterized protein n=1 Tax=Psychrobacillus mangrovi TaxID=3117745 RepID=A0ABU8FCX8_9BACI
MMKVAEKNERSILHHPDFPKEVDQLSYTKEYMDEHLEASQ